MEKKDQRKDRFLQWATTNGAVFDKIDIFATFEGGTLQGVKCLSEIAPNETFLFVPSSLQITPEKARNSILFSIFEAHPSIFRQHKDKDFLCLLLYLMYEHQ